MSPRINLIFEVFKRFLDVAMRKQLIVETIVDEHWAGAHEIYVLGVGLNGVKVDW